MGPRIQEKRPGVGGGVGLKTKQIWENECYQVCYRSARFRAATRIEAMYPVT